MLAPLARAWGNVQASDLQSLAVADASGRLLLPSSDSDEKVQDASLEVYAKRVYRAHNVISTAVSRDDGMTSIAWNFKFNTFPDESSPLWSFGPRTTSWM